MGTGGRPSASGRPAGEDVPGPRRRSGTGSSRRCATTAPDVGSRRCAASRSPTTAAGWTSTSTSEVPGQDEELSTAWPRLPGRALAVADSAAELRDRRAASPPRSTPRSPTVAWSCSPAPGRTTDAVRASETCAEGYARSPSSPRAHRAGRSYVAWDQDAAARRPRRRSSPPSTGRGARPRRGGDQSSPHRRPRRAPPRRGSRRRVAAVAAEGVGLRRARLPAPRRGGRDPAGARRARWRADARRHADRDLPRALRRPARPRHAVRGGCRPAHAATGRGVVRPRRRCSSAPSSARRSASSPGVADLAPADVGLRRVRLRRPVPRRSRGC